ncbi:unnamed protein product [Caenorhabditis brenneri]
MSYSKPLSYECTKTLLSHLEPNTRFRLVRHCPALAKTDKIVPLKIKMLLMEEDGEFTVNEHVYKFGIYRKYRKGAQVPFFHQKENDEGGSDQDLGNRK